MKAWPGYVLAALFAAFCVVLLLRVPIVGAPGTEDLRAAGLIVAQPAPAYELEAAADEIEYLRAEIDRVRAVAPGARVVEVVRASTGPVPTCAPAVETQGRACVLTEDQPLDLQVSEVRLQTGPNRIVAGRLSAYRLEPDPVLLAEAPFSAQASSAETAVGAEAPKLRWGLGPSVFATRDGLMYGMVVVSPTFKAGPLDLAAVGSVGFGAGVVGALALSAKWSD